MFTPEENKSLEAISIAIAVIYLLMLAPLGYNIYIFIIKQGKYNHFLTVSFYTLACLLVSLRATAYWIYGSECNRVGDCRVPYTGYLLGQISDLCFFLILMYLSVNQFELIIHLQQYI